MTATSVASSSQMFSSAFGQPTRSSTPAFNPFANNSGAESKPFGTGDVSDSSQAKRGKRSRFGDHSDNEGKRKANNPFQVKDANLSDGGKQKGKKSDERKKKSADPKKPRTNGDHAKKPTAQNGRSNGLNPFADARPTSSSSAASDDDHVPESRHSDDPHAQKVYEQLRKDGIHPPSWPSQPGNPKNKAEVTKFREKYEAYRTKARASLTKAGLIDDPTKRKTLQDAIDFKGICEDMCPEYEKITRINEMDINLPEKNPKTLVPNTQRMVKKLARSAAGQEAPLPMDVRSVPALQRSLDYLIDDLLRNDDNLPAVHGFLWDRTRAIRRDFTFFSSLTHEEMKTQVYVLENIARFHVTALHLLSQDGKAPEDFVEQQELEQLGKALLSLRDLYDDCNEQGVTCENEAEFRALYLVFHALDPNIIETLQRQWKPNLWRDSDDVRTAVSLVEALQNTQHFHGPLKDAPSLAASAAYQTYFRIIEDPKVSYTMACFAECHFPHLRRSILDTIKKALARPRESSKDVTAAVLNKFLRFDTIEQAIEFAELHNFEFGKCEEDPSDISRQYLILDNRKPLPHHRLQHQFSQNMVEKKRGSSSLPDLIHRSVRENSKAFKTNGSAEPSLFVSDTQKPISKPSTPLGNNTSISSPFNPTNGLGGNSAFNLNTQEALGLQANRSSHSGGYLRRHGPRDDSLGRTTAQDEPLEIWHTHAQATGSDLAFTLGTTSNGTLPTSGSAFQSNVQPKPFSSITGGVSPFTNPFAPTQQQTTPSALTPPVSTSTGSAQSTAPAGAPQNPFASATTPSTVGNAPQTKSPFASASPFKPAEPQPTTLSSSLQSSAKPPTTSFNATPGQQSETKLNGMTTPSAPLELAKPPGISVIPPTPQLPASPFSIPDKALSPASAPGSISSPIPATTQPSIGVNLGIATPQPSVQSPKTQLGGIPTPSLGTVAAPKPMFQIPSTTPQATPTSSILGISPVGPTPTQITKPATPPPPPAPPRDLMGDFAKWFVLGDNGLLEDFQAFMLDNILQAVFRKFQNEQEKKRREEEEARAIEEATQFRTYSLSVKYFYRWREIARELRLKQLRRSGRDQMKSYYEAQRAAQLKAQREAARRAAREQAELAELNRPEEFKEMLKHKRPNKRQAEDALRASGVLSGIDNEEGMIAKIVNRPPSVNGSVSSSQSKLSRSSSRGGSKTQALRAQLLGEPPASFRRSLPVMSSRDSASSDSGARTSRVSERWRLKAMGIVQMPDGTALPESLAKEAHYGKKGSSGVGSMGPPTKGIVRRASIADLTRPEERSVSSPHKPSNPAAADTVGVKHKRKRTPEDDGELNDASDSQTGAHKRVMSDAQNLMSELRAMREEMEEGASWFRDQNERLHSELASRGSTPWDETT